MLLEITSRRYINSVQIKPTQPRDESGLLVPPSVLIYVSEFILALQASHENPKRDEDT